MPVDRPARPSLAFSTGTGTGQKKTDRLQLCYESPAIFLLFTWLSYPNFDRAFVSLLQDYRIVKNISVISSQMLLKRFRTEL